MTSHIDLNAYGAGRRGGADFTRIPPIGAILCSLLFLLLGPNVAVSAEVMALKDISAAALSDNRVEIRLVFSAPVSAPVGFSIDNPPRIALDFPGVSNELSAKNQPLNVGVARSITAVEAQGRTRVVLNLSQVVPYHARVEGSVVALTLESGSGEQPRSTAGAGMATEPSHGVSAIDFRRGEGGEGRVVVTLTDPNISSDVRQEGKRLVVDFLGANLPVSLARRYDVTDFATPISSIAASPLRGKVHLVITPTGEFEHSAYQVGDEFVIEVRPITKREKEEKRKAEFKYTGEKLSLNFQDIEVRAVLQLLADFTGLNLVASDTVQGRVTLRLQNVPWDQALDIILKTKGLDKRLDGNVLMVAPAEEIAAREKLELETRQQVAELAPLRSEIVQVNYAKAADLAALLKAKENNFLSSRGSVTIDERTNVLLVQDTAQKLEEIRKLVTSLDMPVRQVLIESRIVVASNDFGRELGVRWGLSRDSSEGQVSDSVAALSGTLNGTTEILNGETLEMADRLNVNLPVQELGSAAGSVGLALAKLPFGTLLELELSAMESEGRGEVISSPRVITSNQKEALIEAGTEIPYQEASSSGATSVSFKKAVLSLKVVPQITPDDRVIMDLTVNKDSVGEVFAGVPSIDTKQVSTQVLVDNGETVVLGGIYEQDKRYGIKRVPFFGELPYVGWLFRTKYQEDNKEELLLFVTPKILQEAFQLP